MKKEAGIVLLCVLIGLAGCHSHVTNVQEAKLENKQAFDQAVSKYELYDNIAAQLDGRQVFNGQWEVTDAYEQFFHPYAYSKEEVLERVQGELTIEPSRITFNEEVYEKNAYATDWYTVCVLENDPEWFLYEMHAPYHKTPTNEELGISGEYMIMLIGDGLDLRLDHFYLLDSQELIAIDDGYYVFKLERTGE